MARGTAHAAHRAMAILLISWTGASIVFCLAILGAAARSVPRMDEQMAPGGDSATRRELAAMLNNVQAASPTAEVALPAPCQAA